MEENREAVRRKKVKKRSRMKEEGGGDERILSVSNVERNCRSLLCLSSKITIIFWYFILIWGKEKQVYMLRDAAWCCVVLRDCY